METIQQLIELRASIHEKLTAIHEDAEKTSGGVLSADQSAEYHKAEAEFDSVEKKIAALNEASARRAKLSAIADQIEAEATRRVAESSHSTPARSGDSAPVTGLRSDSYDRLFRSYLSGGNPSPAEFLALQVDVPSSGGYLVASEKFSMDFIAALKNEVAFRRDVASGGLGAKVIPLTDADSLGVPSLENDPADADWTGEITAASEDSTMSFGKRVLKPTMVTKLLKVSKTLLRKSPMAEALVLDRMAYKMGVTHEAAFTTGTGANQPLGVFTASNSGISTGRDVTTTATGHEADKFLEAVGTLRAPYLTNARWLLHRLQLRRIRQLKDGEGNYLLQVGLAAGVPNTIVGYPYVLSEYAPSTATSGDYVAVLGDFSNYWIADCLQIEIQRVDQLYASTNQDGFFIRAETDGMPVLEEAFARIKLA